MTLFNVKTEISDVPRLSAHCSLIKRNTCAPSTEGTAPCLTFCEDAVGEERTRWAPCLSAPSGQQPLALQPLSGAS